MKSIYTTIAAVLLSVTLFAQAPQKMSYQAVVRNANDVLLSNRLLGMQVSILQGSISGTSIYTERHIPTSNANGLVTLEIGTGIVSIGDFSTIDWGNGPYFLKTQYDLTGGSNYTITGTSQLVSVPYALYASVAGSIADGGCGHYVGELFGGGIVYAVWNNGCNGLIASLDDLNSTPAGVSWGAGSNTATGAVDFYDGATNTTTIVNALGATGTYPAQLCADYNGGGFTDWYLPSHTELKQIEAAVPEIQRVLANDGDSTTNPISIEYTSVTGIIDIGTYWSSSELTTNNGVWAYSFYLGSFDNKGKPNLYKVRAVRAF